MLDIFSVGILLLPLTSKFFNFIPLSNQEMHSFLKNAEYKIWTFDLYLSSSYPLGTHTSASLLVQLQTKITCIFCWTHRQWHTVPLNKPPTHSSCPSVKSSGLQFIARISTRSPVNGMQGDLVFGFIKKLPCRVQNIQLQLQCNSNLFILKLQSNVCGCFGKNGSESLRKH